LPACNPRLATHPGPLAALTNLPKVTLLDARMQGRAPMSVLTNVRCAGARLVDWFPVVLVAVIGIAIFDWTDYHVRGASAFIGINPRCIDQFGGTCFKLDAANPPWDATAAIWLDQAFRLLSIAGVVIGICALACVLISSAIRRLRG
jgi:hypothetical protein